MPANALHAWYEQELASLRQRNELFESGTARFHEYRSGQVVDTTSEVIASNKAKIAELERLLGQEPTAQLGP